MTRPLLAALVGAVATGVALGIAVLVPIRDLLPFGIILWALPAIAGVLIRPTGSRSIAVAGAIGSAVPWTYYLVPMLLGQYEDAYPQNLLIPAAISAAAFAAGYGLASLLNRSRQPRT